MSAAGGVNLALPNCTENALHHIKTVSYFVGYEFKPIISNISPQTGTQFHIKIMIVAVILECDICT